MVAQDMPSGIAAAKPGLIPAGALIAEVPDLGRAVVSGAGTCPLIRPVDSGPADLGPEGQPHVAVHSCHSADPVGIVLDIILITATGGRFWIDGLIALRHISVRRCEAAAGGAGGATALARISAGNTAHELRLSLCMWCSSWQDSPNSRTSPTSTSPSEQDSLNSRNRSVPVLRFEQDRLSPHRQPASLDPCKACRCCNREERGSQSRDWVELGRRRAVWSGSPCRHCRCIRTRHQNHSHRNTDLSPCPFLNRQYRRRNSGTRLIVHSDSWHCWDTHRCRCSSTSSGNCKRGHASPVHLRRTIPF